jgi:hypothetical protein
MPPDFLKCVREGGKVRTIKLKGNKYLHACKDKSGKWHRGEVKTNESSTLAKVARESK